MPQVWGAGTGNVTRTGTSVLPDRDSRTIFISGTVYGYSSRTGDPLCSLKFNWSILEIVVQGVQTYKELFHQLIKVMKGNKISSLDL